MTLTTADVAKAGRTTARGVHIWETQNLFGEVARDVHGARVFNQAHLDRAKLIAAAQMSGLSIAEIHSAFTNHKSMVILHQRVEEAMIFLKRVRDSIYQEFDL